MKHDTAAELLHDYLDGELDEALVERLEGHVNQCVTCRGELDGLRLLLERAAALPRSIEPGRDLWPAIAGATLPLESSAEGFGSRLLKSLGFFSWSWPTALATAAVAGVLFISSFNTEPPVRPGEDLSPEGAAAADDADPQAAAMVRVLEAECLQGERELAAYSDTNWQQSTVNRMLKESMPVVDRAIAEARAAWLASPDEPGLARLLASAYRAKVALQGKAVRMSSES